MLKSLADNIKGVLLIAQREVRSYLRRPMMLFCLLVAPICTVAFFTSLMWSGLPTDLPAAVVDEDDTQVTRQFIRTMDALQQTDIVAHYATFGEARLAMQRGEVYAIFYIPKGTTRKAIANRQPQISFYTSEIYFIPASLLMKDLRMASELLGISLTRESLYVRGLTPDQAMGIVQPIVIEKHALNNPWLNYSVYLCNVLLPGMMMILIMLLSGYAIGEEWKRGTQRQVYRLAGCSQTNALVGKLLPLTVVFTLYLCAIDVYLYKFLGFPCHCPIWHIWLWGFLSLMASQGLSLLFFGIFVGQMRFSMSLCSLWGIVSVSMSGFTFPVSAMHPVLQFFANLFPLRHYFLIYVNQALNGYPIGYVWPHVLALLVFMAVPLLVHSRYRMAFLKAKYIP